MASFITRESIDEVSSRTDIVRLVGEYVQLEQRGNDWWGCCPFHHEKTPSFSVSADKRFYYCFGCHASGTAVNFVMEMEKVSYAEAIEILAKKAGVTLSYTDSGSASQREDPSVKLKEEMVSLYTRVAGSFHYMLMETQAGKFALDYITRRGISPATLEKFKIGYSPADRKWLRKFLVSKNYSGEFLDKSGLFSSRYPDIAFFSDRLMFPIFNKKGDVVALGGRFLRGDEEHSPKYLNSGDLIHYKKGSTLYAFNFARNSIREHKKVIFCEGYMDCIAYHQCGIDWAVAPLGTALTEEQVMLVKPFVEEVCLSFDSDGAGQNATKRAVYMCRKLGIHEVRIVKIEGGKDPAEVMVKFGPEYLTNVVNSAILDSNYLLSKLQEVYSKDSPEGKVRASLEFFDYIDCLQSSIQMEACLDKFCQAFNVEREAVQKDYNNRDKVSQRLRNLNTEQKKPADEKIIQTAELHAVMTAVTEDSSLFRKMQEEITVEDLEDDLSRQLFIVMDECCRGGVFSIGNILNRIENDAFKRIIIQSVNEHSANIGQSVSESISYLKKCSLVRQRNGILKNIGILEKSPLAEDRAKVSELLKTKMELDFKLKSEGFGNG